MCGFDAYINGKHVIGIVEEKGQARKSYDKAKQEGHGAYLMEEEATVSGIREEEETCR